MNTPVPPKIPSSGQLSSIKIDGISNTIGNSVINAFSSSYGGSTLIETNDVTYTATAFCKGIIIRTGNGTDTFPDAADVATTLGLSINSTFQKQLSIINATEGAITVNLGAHTTLLYSGFGIPSANCATYTYNIWYDESQIWQMQMFLTGLSETV